MNIKRLKKILKKKVIPVYYYKICEKGISDNKVNLDYKDGKWIVYYSERGDIFSDKEFESESEACEEVLLRFSDRLK